MSFSEENILQVKNLVTSFDTEAGQITVLDKVSFDIKKGEILGIVGESGCGKSVTSLSVMRLLPKPAGNIAGGEVLFKGEDISKIKPAKMHHIRGNKIAMIFQEPMTALNPLHKIGRQLGEVFELHFTDMNSEKVKQESIKMLEAVGIPDPERRLNEYPHQLSGGIRQRVMIAIALACKPELLIADEPTTALDVTIQAQILKLIKDMQIDLGMACMFITHDLGVIAEICDSVVVMYAGKVVEKANVFELFKNPKHPYTRGLLNSIPKLDNTPKTELGIIEGMVPSLYNLPKGCRFENRCPYATEECKQASPELEVASNNHYVSCFRYKEI